MTMILQENAVEHSPEGGLTFIEQLHNCLRTPCSRPKTPYGIGVDTASDRVLLSKFYCNQWDCPECAARLARRWIARVINGINRLGGEWHFLTLTVGSNNRKEKSLETLRRGWRAFYTCLDALAATKDIQPHYAKVWEQQKDGSFHIHALTDIRYSQRWTKDTSVYSGLGHQADWREVKNAGQAAGYIAKYSLKNIETAQGGVLWPRGLRRVETSRNWPKLPKLSLKSQWEWIIKLSREEQLKTAEIYEKHGFQITDKVKEDGDS